MEHQSNSYINRYGKLVVRRLTQVTPDFEEIHGTSLAVPDLSYSVSELVQKFSVGNLPSEVVRQVLYTDNPDFDDFVETELGNFDLVDAHREISKLRELHSIRMERRKAAGQQGATSEPSPSIVEQEVEK